MARLLATEGPLKGREFPLGPAGLIGRDPAATVVLAEATASRRHAELRWDGRRLHVRDLGSHNGTFVNGKRVKSAELVPGETLGVGDHTFLLAPEGGLASTVAPAPARRFQLETEVTDFELLGDAPAFRACLETAERLAASDAPVLLTGETGTGKELLTRWIHKASRRARGPFVPVNMAAVPESLFEAELFGAEAGAFTGASARRAGKFELASGGTLFLDEIGELPLPLQPKLLRAVQERAFYRVGGSAEVRIDARILAATNRDLASAARDGRFREDLYHRLGALLLRVPSLRERAEDIPLLAGHFTRRAARRLGKGPEEVPAGILSQLSAYPWPGNVRELQNVVERWVITGVLALSPAASAPGTTLADAEREAIRKALDATGGKKGEAAKRLGISWPTLRRKIRLYKLAPEKDDTSD